MSKIIGLMVSNLYVGTPDKTQQIDKKYIFPEAYSQSGLNYDGNKWIASPGYGMYVKGEECEIEWDGDPTGKETASVFCKVSDLQLSSPYSLIGGELIRVIDGEEREYTIEAVADLGDEAVAYKGIYFINGQNIIYSTITASIEGIPLTPGFWFQGTSTSNYVKSLVKDDDDVVVPFWRDYIPLKMNSNDTVTHSKLTKLKFGSEVYQVGDDIDINPGIYGSTTPLTVMKFNDQHYSIPYVEGNPSSTADTPLNKLKINGKIYSVGGTNVIANPTTTATSELSKLTVGDTTYSVGGGSGSSKHLKSFNLYHDDQTSAYYRISGEYYSDNTTIPSNFDAFLLDVAGGKTSGKCLNIRGKYKENNEAEETLLASEVSNAYVYLSERHNSMAFYHCEESAIEGYWRYTEELLFEILDYDAVTVETEVIY